MKILLIGSLAESLLNFRGPLIKAFMVSGHEVHVAAPNALQEGATSQNLVAMGCLIHEYKLSRTGTNPIADIFSLLSLLKLLRQVKPNLVLAYTIKPVIYGMLAAKVLAIPHRYALITGLGYAFQGGSKRKGIRSLAQKLYALAIRCCHKVFFQNPDDEALFKESKILKKTPSTVVNGSGVDLAHYAVAPLPTGDIVFLMIARLLGDKGVREYAEAAKAIKSKYPNARFQLAGWLDNNPNSISQIELDSWTSSGAIEFLGKLEDVRPALANCHVYVLPSYREGTPRSVLEAMSIGRAIITTNTPGCKETVNESINGYLVPTHDAIALKNAMGKYILNPEYIVQHGNASLKIAQDKYDVHKVNAHMLSEMGL